jgi:hypothetical protein
MDGKSHLTGNSLYGEMIHMHRPDAQMPAIPDLDLRRTLLGIWRFFLPLYVGFGEPKHTPRFGNMISSLTENHPLHYSVPLNASHRHSYSYVHHT